MNEDEMLEQCQAYADKHESFDRDFIDSLRDSLYEYDQLTFAQYSALENIYNKFRIKKWFDNDDSEEELIEKEILKR
jgi:hypothetical protein